MALINCPECGKEVSDQALSCPNCGYAISSRVEKPREDNSRIILLLILLFAIMLAIGYAVINESLTLSGKEKIAYDIAVKCAEQSLKDPESLQLLSGQIIENYNGRKNVLACKIRATNSFGAYVTERYIFYPEGRISELTYSTGLADKNNDFDIDKVNTALQKHFGKK